MGVFSSLNEEYKSKWANMLDEDDDKKDDEDDEDDDNDEEEEKEDSDDSPVNKYLSSSKSDKEDKKEEPVKKQSTHLSKTQIRDIMNIVTYVLKDFYKLKKCCDYVDLDDREFINDDGKHESPYERYEKGKPTSFIKLIDGDVMSGYPNYRNGGSEEYDDDSEEFVKKVNKALNDRKFNVKFTVGKDKDDDTISYGIKLKEE